MEGVWQWASEAQPVWAVIVMTLLPIFELRASIPFGLLATDLPPWVVIVLAVLTNWLLAPVLYLLLKYALHLALRWNAFARLWQRYSDGVQHRIHRGVETYGAWGLAFFIGIPLPGSGVYTGAVGAYVLGMGFRRFMLAALVGVCMAAVLVTLAALSGSEAFRWMVTR